MSELIEITRDNVIQILRAAVDEKGADYVDERSERPGPGSSCAYVVDPIDSGTSEPRPGCIVGTALYLRGVSIEELEWMDNGGTIMDLMGWRENVRDEEMVDAVDYLPDNLEISPQAAAALAGAQFAQDQGNTWGSSLAFAERTLETL